MHYRAGTDPHDAFRALFGSGATSHRSTPAMMRLRGSTKHQSARGPLKILSRRILWGFALAFPSLAFPSLPSLSRQAGSKQQAASRQAAGRQQAAAAGSKQAAAVSPYPFSPFSPFPDPSFLLASSLPFPPLQTPTECVVAGSL